MHTITASGTSNNILPVGCCPPGHGVDPIPVISEHSESWPGLSRPSTSSLQSRRKQDVDARDNRGHDAERVIRPDRNPVLNYTDKERSLTNCRAVCLREFTGRKRNEVGMTVVAQTRLKLSGAQFRSFQETRPDRERWELIDGVPIMMVPPILSHQRIADNLARLLNDALARHEPTRIAISRAGVDLGETALAAIEGDYRPEPDVMVIDADFEPRQRFVQRAYVIARNRVRYRPRTRCVEERTMDRGQAAALSRSPALRDGALDRSLPRRSESRFAFRDAMARHEADASGRMAGDSYTKFRSHGIAGS